MDNSKRKKFKKRITQKEKRKKIKLMFK